MVKIIVLERNVMLRTGIVQLLSQVLPDTTIEAYGYATLDQPPDESRQGGLVLLSIPSPERRDSLIQASERAFAPKGIILMLDGEPTPASMHALPPIVGGFVDKAAAPEVFLACIRLLLSGGESSRGFMDADPPSTSARALALAPARVSASARASTSLPLKPPARQSIESPRNAVPMAAPPAAFTIAPDAARMESSLLGLTPRQYEVLVLLARGDALKSIARQLNITVATTKAHTEGLYQRLDVHNRNAAVYVARSRGAGLGWAPRQAALELRAPQD